MGASQVMHRCIISALLVFAFLWLRALLHRYVHGALTVRRKLPLLLISCALTYICDLILLILNEL